MKSEIYTLKTIGIVENSIQAPVDPSHFKDIESKIIISKIYQDALYRIEDSEYIQVVFYFHKSHGLKDFIHPTRLGERKGNFASRSPHRINPIGITTVKLLKKDGNILYVKGLDAIDKTPVIDLKPFIPLFDAIKIKRIESSFQIANPRAKIINLIKKKAYKELYSLVGTLHGHYCPGSALGFHLSIRILDEIQKYTDGIHENLIAIVEMNNCAVDAIQLITGCSLGNNSLIFQDLGINALTLAIRDGKAIRAVVRSNWRDIIPSNPKYSELFEKVIKKRVATQTERDQFKVLSTEESFRLIDIPSDKIIRIEEIEVHLPVKAPIHDSFICTDCGEMIMGSRKTTINANDYCLKCGHSSFYELNGTGILKKKIS